MKLTATIIAKNEENDILRTIESLKFTDRIVVIDSGSTDKTVPIAKKAGAEIIFHPFASYSEQRNFADSIADSDWILSMDADMVVPQELADEILKVINTTGTEANQIGRINIIWGKKITVADWGPKDDLHIWLYKKGSGKWQSAVHEEFICKGNVGILKNNFLHYNYDTISEFIDKGNFYSDLAVKNDGKYSWFSPIVDFGKRYFYKLGFLAGYHGLFLSYLQAVYYVTLKVKLWQAKYT